jgi:fatty-acyl-CoA synthase
MDAGHLLAARAASTPDREAIYDLATGRRYSYDQLNRRANRVANALRQRCGVSAGDRVAILAHNCIEYVDLFYAVGKLGAILVPLNWRLTEAELAHILGDSEPLVLVAGTDFADVAGALRDQVDLAQLVLLGDPWDQLTAAASDREPERPPLTGDDPYCIMYTSGTTGRPKGAVIPHRQVLWNCINTAVGFGLSAADVSPVLTPLFHAGGLFAFLTPILYLGGRVVLGRGFRGEADLETIESERCTVILGVPTIFRMWHDTPAYRAADFGHVRYFITGGAPCPDWLMQAWRDDKRVAFRQGYGLTEVGPNCFAMTDADSTARPGSIGRPIFHSQARLVGGGDTGELALRGPHVCTGYWRNPEATRAALKDGWFHTGDVARRDPDGFYYIAGRQKEMIISGGENIYAAEVEAVINDHPEVAESALIGQPDDRWGEVGVIVVIPRGGHGLTEEQLLQFCADRLARYKIPRRVVFADDFPRTALGKPRKPELQRIYAP